MKFYKVFINMILLGIGLALAGCQTADEQKDLKKQLTAIQFHLEVHPYSGDEGITASIFRESPVKIKVQADAFLDERDVASAQVLDWMGGPAISIQFNRHGTWMLENETRSDATRRLAITCGWDKEVRWIAAPIIGRPISNGVLTFTPDASQEECERIVRGLNNAAAKIKKNSD